MPGEKILLADDDPLILRTLNDFLSGQGYVVKATASGQEALEAIKEDKFHVALFDLKLPDLSGLELLSYLKSDTPDTEVILFTGYAGLETAIQALRLGAYDYLVKSEVRFAELQAVVERALERRRLSQVNRELCENLQQAQEELKKRWAAELVQIRRIGEALAGPLAWEQLIQGLLNLIWESLPLAVLGLEVQGMGEELPLRDYRCQEGLTELTLAAFQAGLQARLKLLMKSSADVSAEEPTSPEMPFPAMLWEEIQAGEVLALVAAGRQAPFTAEEAELFRIFILQAEAALKNLLLFEQVKSLAIRDGLTGLYNYRHFWELLAREVELSRRYGRPLSLLFLDIDDFKKVNDTFGHPQGDLVLKTLAGYLQGSVRQTDLVCRYGGEEFVVILAQTPAEQGRVMAERLRTGIAATPIAVPGRELKLTVSIGVAGLKPGMNGEALVQAADDALYRAKQAGKNRVMGPERQKAVAR
jgi:diguanylate cyclase (GGDEF)-like protein